MASYEKSKASGLWSVRFREINTDGTPKQRRLSGFRTKKDAQHAYEDFIKARDEKKDPKQPIIGDYYFEDFLNIFFEYKKGRVKESTYYDISKKINTRILPFFKGWLMKDITPAVILEWQNTLKEFQYSYIKTLHIVLGSIWTYADKYYDFPNVMKKVDRPRNFTKKKEMPIYTPEEFEKFITQVKKPQYYHYFKFLYLSGLRPEEACALTWRDVNFSTGAVTVNKNITYKAKDPGKTYQVTTTKNASSDRVIYLPYNFCKKLKEYKQWQIEAMGDCEYIFTNGDGPLPPASISRERNKASDRAGLHRIRTHDLRHSCASLLIHQGASVVAISHLFGHSTPQVTWSTYAHMFPDDQTKIAEIMSNYV